MNKVSKEELWPEETRLELERKKIQRTQKSQGDPRGTVESLTH